MSNVDKTIILMLVLVFTHGLWFVLGRMHGWVKGYEKAKSIWFREPTKH
jgi:hypothetical protein